MIDDDVFDAAMHFDKDSYDEKEVSEKIRLFYDTMVKDKPVWYLMKLKMRPIAGEFIDIINLELFRRADKKINNKAARELYEKRQEMARKIAESSEQMNPRWYDEGQKILSEMTPDLLELSDKIVDDIGITVKTKLSKNDVSALRRHHESTYGHYGIPYHAKKVLITSGDKIITVNNEAIQESYRTRYYKNLIDMSGIEVDPKIIDGFAKENPTASQRADKSSQPTRQTALKPEIDLDEYEIY